MTINQIRSDVPKAIRALEWVCFGSTSFDTVLPIYTNVERLPDYLSKVSTDVSTENFYWGSRLLGALADPNYGTSIVHIERYQNAVMSRARAIVRETDKQFMETQDPTLPTKANQKLCNMAREETTATLNKVLLDASQHMKNGYHRGDN